MVKECDAREVDLSAPAVRSRLNRIKSLCRDHAEGGATQAADPLALITDVVGIVRELVPAAGYCALTIDPVSLLHTGLVSPALTGGRMLRPFLASEHGIATESHLTGECRRENESRIEGDSGNSPEHSAQSGHNGGPRRGEPTRPRGGRADDAHTFAAMADRPEPVGVLSAQTEGEPARSARYRDVLRPAGYRDELSALLRDGGDTWGAFALWRGVESADFTTDELAMVRSVVPQLAEGVRRALLRVSAEGTPEAEPLAGGEDQAGPGLVLLTVGPQLEADVATSATADWLDLINDARVCGVPSSLVGAAFAALSRRHEVRFQLCGTSGQWLEINVTPLSERRAAVIIQPCHPWASARIIARAYGLSPREQDVALLVLRGRRTKDIAGTLFVSPYTVQDHLKRIFHKTGARSRAELVGRVFFGCALPRQAEMPAAEPRMWDGTGVVTTP